jgi:F-type H+-transporting ATPase subunit b
MAAMLDLELTTFIFQIVNFFILLACLTWFLYRPLLRVMKKREADIAAKLHDADERARKADDERRQLAQELQNARAQAEQLLTEARAEASERREQLLRQARTDVADMIEGAKQQIQQQEAAAQRVLQTRIGKTAVTVAGELVRQAIGPTLHAALLQMLVGNSSGLEAEHADLLLQAYGKADGKITVELAYPPSDAQQEQLRTALAHTLGRDNAALQLDFRVEPALVTGLRILVGTVAVDLSLSRTLEELSQKIHPDGEA